MARKGKKQAITIDSEKKTLTIFYPSLKKTITVHYSQFVAELKEWYFEHGMKQRYGDLESGKEPAAKYAAALKLLEANMKGEWEIESSGRDTSGAVLEAVCRIKDLPLDEVTAEFNKKSEDERKKKLAEWRSNVKVNAMIKKIAAEKAEALAAESEDEDDIEVD